jgi:hypothetical protein
MTLPCWQVCHLTLSCMNRISQRFVRILSSNTRQYVTNILFCSNFQNEIVHIFDFPARHTQLISVEMITQYTFCERCVNFCLFLFRHFVLKDAQSTIWVCFRPKRLWPLKYRTMDKVQKPTNPDCHIQSSRSFRIYPKSKLFHLSFSLGRDIKYHIHINTKFKIIHCFLLTEFHFMGYNAIKGPAFSA